MTDFTVHTAASAPAESRPVLEGAAKGWGFVPNLFGILAESPQALHGYEKLFRLVGESNLTPVEQQVAFLTVNAIHECEYCMAGHTVLASMAKVPDDVVAALRDGGTIADARLRALSEFTRDVVLERGNVRGPALDAFLAAGYDQRAVLDVVLVVATKTISNYVNHIARTPNDPFMANTTWVAPSRRAG